MRMLLIAALAATLVTVAASSTPPPDPQYRIVRIVRNDAGEEVSRTIVETFTERDAPYQTLGARLLALHNGNGGEYVAEPVD